MRIGFSKTSPAITPFTPSYRGTQFQARIFPKRELIPVHCAPQQRRRARSENPRLVGLNRRGRAITAPRTVAPHLLNDLRGSRISSLEYESCYQMTANRVFLPMEASNEIYPSQRQNAPYAIVLCAMLRVNWKELPTRYRNAARLLQLPVLCRSLSRPCSPTPCNGIVRLATLQSISRKWV